MLKTAFTVGFGRSRTGGAVRVRNRVAAMVALLLALGAPVVLAPASPAAGATCPCSIWSATTTPGLPSDPDTAAVEVGTKFRSDIDGVVTGVRFYKGSGNTGTHVGHLWTSTGTNLGTVTFTGETSTGWQQALFPAPIPISANATYVISYYAPNGRYATDSGYFATSGVDNAPLHALRDGVDGSNGVYRYGTGGGFPTNSWEAANYWVDVVFDSAAADTTAPTVTSTSPASNATGVPLTTTVTATLSEPVQAGGVRLDLTANGSAVPGSTAYDATSRTVTFTPSTALSPSTSHTVRVSGATDASGNTMAPYSWSFTTAASGSGCPCTIWPNSAVPAVANVSDSSAVELGVKFRTSTPGYLTGLRFYKGSSNTGTHTGSLWTRTGTRLATVTFSGESASGWQTATLPAPVQVAANTTYVASYHTDVGFYSATSNGLASAVSRGPLTALANGTDGGNGVYLYGGGGFPTNTYQASNYWVDVVFDTTAVDVTAPTVTSRSPAPDAIGVPTSAKVTAAFSEAVTASSIAMTLTGPGGAVPGTVAYDSTATTATFTPSSALSSSTSYTATASGARDAAGNVMSPVTWSFTTAAPPPPGPEQGPGGSLLLITNSSTSASQFSPYTAEILRAEGLNQFATADLATVSATMLNQYDVVLLGSMPLTAAQVTMFSNWVTAGGNLIAFRPDKQLAPLLGLGTTTNTLAEGYLKVDSTTAPGAGITNQTIQFHGTADRYTLNGARAVATLYSSASTATSNPAVSLVNVGTSGGQAAAFTYELPRSIVYTRQGNPAWEKQERDNQAPIRSDDLYFGGSSRDWVDLTKVAIPQADEQQRLLANLIGMMDLDRKPLPRFWYFPRSAKAVVVATGDDHANGGTAGRFDQYAANSAPGCVVSNWECLRFTSYVYVDTPLSNSQAAAYNSAGFEVGLHVGNNCNNFTPASLESDYANQLSDWSQKYSDLPAPTTNRYHCIVWSDWSSQPSTELAHGIRLDTNYYYWPGAWVNDRPGFMTGSGMPMRFTDKTGSFIDVYQAATQMTDESDQSYPFTPNALLDNAIGPLGYYGAFTANMHTDYATTFDSDQLLASATAYGVPVVSARQMLAWLNGRNGSSYSGVSWADNRLSFTVNVGSGANGLTGMVPTLGPAGSTLTGLTRGGSAVAYTRATIKGVEYAMFLAAPGTYVATYGSSGFTTATTTVRTLTASTATLDVAGSTATAAEVVYGTSPVKLTERVLDGTRGGRRTLTLEGLKPSTTYYYRVKVHGPAGTASSGVQSLTTAARDVTAPVLSGVDVFPLPDGTAAVSWRTDENADAALLIGETPKTLVRFYSDRRDTTHTVVATRLKPGTTYYYRVKSVDAAGNASEWPAAGRSPAAFVSAANGVADRTAAQFRTTNGANATYVQQDDLGELSLAPAAGAEFTTSTLPSDWQEGVEAPGGAATVVRGNLVLDGRSAATRATFGPGRSLVFRVTFTGHDGQWAGLAAGTRSDRWAMFGVRNGALYAAVNASGLQTIQLPAGLIGTPHVYRIDWTSTGYSFYVDDRFVGSKAAAVSSMRALTRDTEADGKQLLVDWVRLSGHARAGSQVSRVLDAQQMVTWDRLIYRADVPRGTSLRISVRTGNTATPDRSWTGWVTVDQGGRVDASSRYIQYRVEMSTTAVGSTPVVSGIGITDNGHLATPVTESGG